MTSLAQIFADDRADLPTQLGSAELRKLDLQVRQGSLFSARMNSAEAVQRLRDYLKRALAGADNQAEFRVQVRAALKALGYTPGEGFPGEASVPPAEADTLTDLTSRARLDLILNTQRAIVDGYAYQQHGNTAAALDAFPAWELVRVLAVEVPRGERRGPKGTLIPVPDDDWPSRWTDAGGSLADDDRMVAAKDDAVWDALGDVRDDSIDNGGAPPFAFNSGMGWRQVDRDEAVALGVIDPDETPEAGDTDFGPKKISIDGQKYDADILKELVSSLRAGALAKGVTISVTK